MSYGSPLAKPITASKIRAEFNKQMGLAPTPTPPINRKKENE